MGVEDCFTCSIENTCWDDICLHIFFFEIQYKIFNFLDNSVLFRCGPFAVVSLCERVMQILLSLLRLWCRWLFILNYFFFLLFFCLLSISISLSRFCLLILFWIFSRCLLSRSGFRLFFELILCLFTLGICLFSCFFVWLFNYFFRIRLIRVFNLFQVLRSSIPRKQRTDQNQSLFLTALILSSWLTKSLNCKLNISWIASMQIIDNKVTLRNVTLRQVRFRSLWTNFTLAKAVEVQTAAVTAIDLP